MASHVPDDEERRADLVAKWSVLEADYERRGRSRELDRLRALYRDASGVESAPRAHALQRPYAYYVPGLEARPFHEPREHAWTSLLLERNFEAIRGDLLALDASQSSAFREYGGEGDGLPRSFTERPAQWRVFYFYRERQRIEASHLACPSTSKVLDELSRLTKTVFGMVAFSRLEPGARIVAHTGPSNARLTAHLGLLGCRGVTACVGGVSKEYEDGKVLLFDDSFVHSVSHGGTEVRTTLMLDVWHPGLTETELEVLNRLMTWDAKRY
jgi:aspartyl/asparaginyl beta-hydroxylase (cupin superfamily)